MPENEVPRRDAITDFRLPVWRWFPLRRPIRLAVLVGLAVVLFVWMHLVQPPQGWPLTWSDYDRVQTGMTRRQVEAELGPPGDYRSGQTEIDLRTSYDLVIYNPESSVTVTEWANDGRLFVVFFDDNGRVVYKFGRPNPLVPQNPIENLFWRTKRLWRQWFP